MSRDILSKMALEHILKSPKLKGTTEQTARVLISRIHQENPGISMNAAAYLYAKNKGIGIYGYLKPEDKLSLTNVKQKIISPARPEKSTKQTKPRELIPELDSPFVPEALKNAAGYPFIYIWENTLREITLKKFGTDEKWWNDTSKVSREIQDYSARIALAEKKYPWSTSRGNHPIYYVGLVELFSVIDKNWSTFKDVFKDLEQLRAWTKECAPIRNLIAHNIPISNADITNLKIKAIYLWRIARKWQTRDGLSSQTQETN